MNRFFLVIKEVVENTIGWIWFTWLKNVFVLQISSQSKILGWGGGWLELGMWRGRSVQKWTQTYTGLWLVKTFAQLEDTLQSTRRRHWAGFAVGRRVSGSVTWTLPLFCRLSQGQGWPGSISWRAADSVSSAKVKGAQCWAKLILLPDITLVNISDRCSSYCTALVSRTTPMH